MKRTFLIAIAATALLNFGCMEKKNESNNAIFKKGDLLSSDIITGKSWHNLLVEHDTTFTTVVGNEQFEAGSRNVWHSHPGGQILIITDGVGYHQIKGQPVQVVRKGDVVKCPPDVVHWHGASKDSDVSQIYILPNSEKGIVKWFDKVTDEEYNNIK
ncbi:cupin domain-containing protein [Paracnuella aquatica]|uniref:cupin domain-containing protein n=1 Tax=Paracnuella aquatica TaxID=2268757 RepID=UPI000DEEA994|nr:cupin domain-containing protein [Paracnuella aquatica]RPD44066.1 cupin domain-containing protein [Paracnuella aquatica]